MVSRQKSRVGVCILLYFLVPASLHLMVCWPLLRRPRVAPGGKAKGCDLQQLLLRGSSVIRGGKGDSGKWDPFCLHQGGNGIPDWWANGHHSCCDWRDSTPVSQGGVAWMLTILWKCLLWWGDWAWLGPDVARTLGIWPLPHVAVSFNTLAGSVSR